jgi:hypothetical protein
MQAEKFHLKLVGAQKSLLLSRPWGLFDYISKDETFLLEE